MNISDAMIRKICSSMIYKRGMEYFREGRVHMRRRSENEITAVVDGDELYNVRVTFDNGGIGEVFCTCPYYETMQTTCKHIAAALKQRQVELQNGGSYTDENDKVAAALCAEFGAVPEPETIRAAFTLYIRPALNGGGTFAMSVSLPDHGGEVSGLENFLDSYLKYSDFKLDRSHVYNRRYMEFPEREDKVIAALAEVYETRAAEQPIYVKASQRTGFGAAAALRIMPLLEGLDFRLVYDGIAVNGVRVIRDDPDILIDIEAYGREIVMSVSERGFAVTPGGEWFLHNDTIYRTSEAWRGFYMPVYRALSEEGRTQITFRGDNAMLFAARVLPVMRGRHGVVLSGVEELVVDEEPRFEVYLDAVNGAVTASVLVRYGGIKFRIPSEAPENGGKIVVRDTESEKELLSYFDGFESVGPSFVLRGDSEVYRFLTETLPELSKKAEIMTAERFGRLSIRSSVNISSSVSYRSDIDLLEISFETDMSAEEMRGILSAVRDGSGFFRFADGGFLRLRGEQHDVLKLLERIGFSNEDIDRGGKLLPKSDMLYLESAPFIKKDGSVTEYMDKIRAVEPAVPKELEGVLRPYQRDGVKWLAQLTEMGMGGILADDMGLGKTLQVIAYVRGVRPEKPVLIVAPSTLTYNWQKEIEKFTPSASSLIISGPREARAELIKKAGEYDFVITSYPLLRRDTALYRSIEFSYCFIDEAQYIKNPKTMNAVSVKRINARRRFALTGTPIENSLMELWSIFDFIMPGYLKSAREFRDRFEKGADTAAANVLRAMIRPFVLRRMKKDVLNELPEKIETTMYADLTREQKAMYAGYLEEVRGEARGILASRGSRFMILTLLLRLRQICCHPELFHSGSGFGSGKLDLLMELVHNVLAAGHRVLIFSQFRSMLDIIGNTLSEAGIEYFCINGSTPAHERVELAELFNGGERGVFLVSLKAGGTGLNLTGADTVVHYDPWWNPAVTDQATDRAYRIGQTRAVNVIRLAARGTIEEKILRLQENKRMLAEDIIRVNTDTLSNLTDEEIMSLFEL